VLRLLPLLSLLLPNAVVEPHGGARRPQDHAGTARAASRSGTAGPGHAIPDPVTRPPTVWAAAAWNIASPITLDFDRLSFMPGTSADQKLSPGESFGA